MSTVEELLAADRTARFWVGNDEASYYLSAEDVTGRAAALAWYEAEVGEPWDGDPPDIAYLPCCNTHEAGDQECTPACQVIRPVWDFGV